MAARTTTICRVASRHKPYSQIGNAMLRDKRLSIDARGTLCFILSHPADWKFSVEWLAREIGVGRQKAQRIVRDLVAHGYCKRGQKRDGRGRMSVIEYEFTDEKDTSAPQVEKQPTAPEVDLPPTGSPPTVNQPLYKEGQSQRSLSEKDSQSTPTTRGQAVHRCLATRTDTEKARFSHHILKTIGSLGLEIGDLIERFEDEAAKKAAKGERIRDPNAYLLSMAHDAAAKMHGATVEQIKGSTSRSVAERAATGAAIGGIAVKQNPAVAELLNRANERLRARDRQNGGLQ
jgi:hypothetical protein